MHAILHRRFRASIAALMLCGCNSPSPGPASGSDVAGRYVNLNGTPVSGVTFRIGSRTTITGADGYFYFSSVPASYDLVVEGSPLTVYEGVTRRDPVLTFANRYEPRGQWAEMTGRLPHSGFPAFVVAFATGGLAVIGFVDSRTDAYYVGLPSGYPAGAQRVTVLAIQQGATGTSTWASRTVRVTPGSRVVVDFQSGDFGPVTFGSVSVRTSPPAAGDPVQISARGVLGGAPVPFTGGFAVGSESMLRLPTLPGMTFDVEAYSYSTASGNRALSRVWGVRPDTNPVQIVLHRAPSQQSPADSALVDSSTALAWAPGDGSGVFQLRVYSTSEGTDVAIERYTNRLEIPSGEISPSGLPMTHTSFQWQIAQTYAAQSVDELLQAGRTFEDNISAPNTSRGFRLPDPALLGPASGRDRPPPPPPAGPAQPAPAPR